MGLFGPSKAQQEQAVYELGVALFAAVSKAADTRLQAGGLDAVTARGPIRSRVRAAVAQHSNQLVATLKYPDVKRFAAQPDQWQALVSQTAAAVEQEALAGIAARPPIPSTATKEARYGPHWKEVTAFLERLAAIDADRWFEFCRNNFAMATAAEAARFRELHAQALYAKSQVTIEHGLGDQAAWAHVDAEDVAHSIEARSPQAISFAQFPPGGRAYRMAADGAVQDVAVAASALVVGDLLNTEHYAVLVSGFGPEIMGQAAHEQSQRDFHEAQQALGRQNRA